MRKVAMMTMMAFFVTASAQKLETESNFPTGYMETNYFSASNTIKSIDGVLYMLFEDVPIVLVRYPAMNEREEFEVPPTVRRINNNAFQGTKFLKTLKIHNTVTYGNFIKLLIGDSAFNDSSIENFVVIENDGISSVNTRNETVSPSKIIGRYDLSGRAVDEKDGDIQIVIDENHVAQKVLR